jgi:hypothetical protein
MVLYSVFWTGLKVENKLATKKLQPTFFLKKRDKQN